MNILVLIIILKWDAENCTREIAGVHQAIKQPFKRAMQASKNMGFVVTTRESEEELVERLRPVLEVGAIEDYWCFVAPAKIICSKKTLDNLGMYIALARSEIGKRLNPKNVREIQIPVRPRHFERTERRIRSTPIEMILNETTDWAPPQKPNRYERKHFHRQNPKSRDDDDSF